MATSAAPVKITKIEKSSESLKVVIPLLTIPMSYVLRNLSCVIQDHFVTVKIPEISAIELAGATRAWGTIIRST